MRRFQWLLTFGFAMSFYFFFHAGETIAQSSPLLDFNDQKIRDRIQAGGFITTKPISAWGSIVGTKDAAVNLSEGEIVYIMVEPGKEVKSGDRFSIVRLDKEVIHPETRKKMGFLVVVSGELVILSGKERMATGRISKSFQSTLLGDRIVPPSPGPESISIRVMKKIEAIVLHAAGNVENVTEKEFLYIDQGWQQGVIVGDHLSIYQRGTFSEEILKKEKGKVPMAKVGEAIVVSVQEDTSTAMVLKSLQAIYIGDKAVSGGE